MKLLKNKIWVLASIYMLTTAALSSCDNEPTEDEDPVSITTIKNATNDTIKIIYSEREWVHVSPTSIIFGQKGKVITIDPHDSCGFGYLNVYNKEKPYSPIYIFGLSFADSLAYDQKIIWRDSTYNISSPNDSMSHNEMWKSDYTFEKHTTWFLVHHFTLDSAWICRAADEAKELYGR